MLRAYAWVTPLLFGSVLFPGRVQADLVTYTDLTAWQAATSMSTTITFAGLIPDNTFFHVPVPPGLTLNGVTFTVDQSVSDASLFEVGANTAGYYVPLLSSQPLTPWKPDPANFKILLPA